MNGVTTRQYHLLADHMAIYDFMVEIYDKNWSNGVPAPFLEYALSSSWMTKDYTHRFRIWEDNGRIVAFVFHESDISHIYFSLRPGYEALAEEMLTYAEDAMPRKEGKQSLMLFKGQDALAKAAAQKGFAVVDGWVDNGISLDEPLEYALPEGFHFVEMGKNEPAKIIECCWKGFNHEAEEGPWDGDFEEGIRMTCAPHFTGKYAVCVANESGEYVCYAGMWWTPQNKLAYMEPLCTVPAYRRKGLAAAALSELAHRMRPLGATHMTGGADMFYTSIGFSPMVTWQKWEKQ